MAKAKEEKKKSADDILAAMQEKGIKIGLDIPQQEWWSTGNMAIDAVCGGGIPVGRISTFAGPYASGKSTCAVSTARSVIESGRRVLFNDYERTLDKQYFKALGVDPDDSKTFTVYTPRTLEDGFNDTRDLVNTGEYGLVIFDSVAKMLTEKEKSGDVASGMNLEKPKLLSGALSQANDYAFENGCSIILLNHLKEAVDISWSGQQLAAKGIRQMVMPGGKGPYFYSSLILWFKKLSPITAELIDPITNEETKTKIGFKHGVEVEKNKVGTPNGITQVINILGEGFSNSRTAFEILLAYDIVHKNGSWFTVRDDSLLEFVPDKVQGEESCYRQLFSSAAGKGTAISLAQDILRANYESLESPSDEVDSGLF